MPKRALRSQKSTTPQTPRTPARGRGTSRKTTPRTPSTARVTPSRNVTDLCLEVLRKVNATTSSYTSPLPKGLTQEEKHEWIQTYINSITPNRVDYKKSPIEAIITKLPRNSILEIKEDPKLKKLMEKFKEPFAKIVERIDYNKENTDDDYEEEEEKEEETKTIKNSIGEEKETDNKIENIVTFDEFEKMEETEPKIPNADFHNPTPGTSKQTESEHNFSMPNDAFVTRRTPLKKRQNDVIEIKEDTDLDDSVEIVKIIPPTRKRVRRVVEKEPEIIELDDSSEKESNGEHEKQDTDGLGKCPICFETLAPEKGITATHCGHIYCTPCIRSSLKSKKACPKCRKHLNNKKIHPLYL